MRTLLALVSWIGFCSAVLLAETSFTVSGRVDDPSGLPVPGAGVTLAPTGEGGAAGAARLQAFADERGEFQFSRVAPGRYRLVAEVEGFAPVTREIRVSGDVRGVVLRLAIERLTEQVEVTAVSASGPPAPENNGDAVTIGNEMLDALPVLDQDVVAAASEFLDEGALGTGGVTLVVDGMETERIGVTASAIEELRINKNPYSAEYSRPGRGRIEVITKQGARELHGEVNLGLRDDHLDARNAFASERPRQSRRRLEGNLTGPLGRTGKNSFLLSAERDVDREQRVVFARAPQGEIRQNVAAPEIETEFSFRWSRHAGERHALALRYSFEREREENDGVGGFTLPEAGFDAQETAHGFFFQHRWFPSSAWMTEFHVRLDRERESTGSLTPDAPQIEVLDSFTGGGAQRNASERETEAELAWVATLSQGDHHLRGGFLLPGLSHTTLLDRDNFGGTFVFATLADFQAGRPLAFSQRVGEPRLGLWTYDWAVFVQDDIRLRPNLTLGAGLRYDRQNRLSDRNNFAPRTSLSWSVDQESGTVVRLGAGVFYDRTGSRAVRDIVRFDGRRLREILLLEPGFPDPFSGGAPPEEQAPNVMRFAPGLRSPYLTQFNVGIERMLARALTLAVNYTQTRGTKLFRSLDRNAPRPPDYVRSNPARNIVQEVTSSGTLKSRSLNVTLRGRAAGLLQGLLQYTYGAAYNDTGGLDNLPADSTDLSREWGYADFDRRHNLRAMASAGLPGGMELGVIYEFESGRPYEWRAGEDRNRDGRAGDRPRGVPRNALRETGERELDVRLARTFRLSPAPADKRPQLRLALDAFNVLNRVNFSRFVGNERSPLFQQPVAAGSARRLQVSIRFEF